MLIQICHVFIFFGTIVCHTIESEKISLISSNQKTASNISLLAKFDLVHYNCNVEDATFELYKQTKKVLNQLHFFKEHKRRDKRSFAANGNKRILELYITNDYSQYLAFNRSVDEVIKHTKEIIYYVNQYFLPLNISIVLVGIEIWKDGDKINTTDNADNLMIAYLKYRQSVINMKIRNDNAQLITRRPFSEGLVGKATVLSLCSWRHSGGVNMDNGRPANHIATTLAHELGHNFGLLHDNESAECPVEKCIMSSTSGGQKTPSKWSKYSLQQFQNAFSRGMDYCLWDFPENFEPVINIDQCGNGILEDGEDCDCGSLEECSNQCCSALNCTLKANANCAVGDCCNLDTCQIYEATTVCRSSSDQCDLPEYCDGKSNLCPINTYLQDGSKCISYEKEMHCFNGKCGSRTSQCKLLWGQTGHDSHPACYQRFNMLGVANGHCGFSWRDNETFFKCNRSNVQCGMLHCEHNSSSLHFWKESLVYTIPEAWVQLPEGERKYCRGVVLDVGETQPDPGMVPDGSECGLGFMCVAQRCRDVAKFLEGCPNCFGNGICNNWNQCHCNEGYGSPTCQYPGVGGSLLSGPINTLHNNILSTFLISILFTIFFPISIYLIHYFLFKQKRNATDSSSPPDPISENTSNELVQLNLLEKNKNVYENLPPKRPIYAPKKKKVPTATLR